MNGRATQKHIATLRSHGIDAALLLLLLCCSACAPRPTSWTPRTIPACTTRLGTDSPELEHDRAYLAALLALDEKGYSILATSEDAIEAQFVSDYKPSASQIRWIVRIRAGAKVTVETSPEQGALPRKTEAWYQRLQHGVMKYRCRELEWLRWEAQNRGLQTVGASVSDGVPGASGSEVPTATESDQAAPEPPPPAARDSAAPASDAASQLAARRGRLNELYRQRAELHLARWIAVGAVGVVVAVTSLSLMVQALGLWAQGCSSDDGYVTEGGRCSTTQAAFILAMVGAGLHVAGAITIGASFPRLFSRLREYKRIRREIKLLRASELALGAPRTPLGITLRTAF